MHNLFRRPSGVYVLRLSVPSALRRSFGKTEIIASTGTRELAIAKITAGALAAQWRQRFIECARLLVSANLSPMNPTELLRVAEGSPLLLAGGYLPWRIAAESSGIPATQLMRWAAEGRLKIGYRLTGIEGYLIDAQSLELNDPELGVAGGYVIPEHTAMPVSATRHAASEVVALHPADTPDVAHAALDGDEKTTLGLFLRASLPNLVFIPNEPVVVKLDALELLASEVEKMRRALASHIPAETIERARATQSAALVAMSKPEKARGHEPLSVALDLYIRHRVSKEVSSPAEITRIRNGCALLIDLMGDRPVAEITTGSLRSFRDDVLSQVPANENKIRLTHKTNTVRESMEAVRDSDWPVMSVSEREKRMRWICAWFSWLLDQQEWIDADPAAPLRQERILTKSERRKMEKASGGRADQKRDAFTSSDLEKIFGAAWYQTGRGELTKQGTYREFMPYYYWLPLLGLFTGGGRINEMSQIHLGDIGRTQGGVWYVNLNESSEDKKLKNSQSNRVVPIHPVLLAAGFDQWVKALRDAGYTRLFPELKHDADKGYGKAATKWFTGFKKRLGFPADGKKTFHSFRHTFINALPDDIPQRFGRQLSGHARGEDARSTVYEKDASADDAFPFVERMNVTLPPIARFDIEAGLRAIEDALRRKNGGRGAQEDLGRSAIAN